MGKACRYILILLAVLIVTALTGTNIVLAEVNINSNLLVNGDFENGLVGWKTVSLYAGTISIEQQDNNSYVKMHHNSTSDWNTISQEIRSKLTPGKTYLVSYKYKTTDNIYINLSFGDDSTVGHSNGIGSSGPIIQVKDGVWHTGSFTFTATSEHPRPDEPRFVVYFDYNNIGDVYLDDISVTEVIPSPDISVVPAIYDFGGEVVVNGSVAQSFTINNNGTADLLLGSISINGANATEFSLQNDTGSGQTVPPGESRTLEVVFAPTSPGAKEASLNIQSNDPDQPEIILPLSGTGVNVTTTVYGSLSINRINTASLAVFTLNISNTSNLYGGDIELHFNPSLLQVTELSIGDAIYGLNINSHTYYDNINGVIKVSSSRTGDNNGFNGNGELLRVTFEGISPGVSDITFGDLALSDSETNLIEFTAQAGQIEVTPGISIKGKVTLQGVRNYAGGVDIELIDQNFNVIATATTDSSGNYLIDHDLNVNPLPQGTFAVGASKQVYLTGIGEWFTPAIGTLTTAPGIELVTGDIDPNNKVDLTDFIQLANIYGETFSWDDNNNWYPYADLNRDNRISIFDLVLLARNYGKVGYSI